MNVDPQELVLALSDVKHMLFRLRAMQRKEKQGVVETNEMIDWLSDLQQRILENPVS